MSLFRSKVIKQANGVIMDDAVNYSFDQKFDDLIKYEVRLRYGSLIEMRKNQLKNILKEDTIIGKSASISIIVEGINVLIDEILSKDEIVE